MGDLESQNVDPATPISTVPAPSENHTIQIEGVQQFFMQALNSVTTNVMIADHNHDIIYMNGTAKQMFRDAADALRSEIPDFDAENLVGNNIDIFHREPSRQRRILEHLDDTYTTKLNVGGRTFRLIANAITENGNRLGTVVELSDLTSQLILEDAAHQRVEVEHLRKVKLMNTIIRELHHRIKNDLQGVIGLLRRSLSSFPEGSSLLDNAIRQITAIATIYSLQSQSANMHLKLEDMVAAFVAAIESTHLGRLKLAVVYDGTSDCFVSKQDALSISLIINELLTNAAKHYSCSNQDEVISVRLDSQLEITRLCICNPAENVFADFDTTEVSGNGTGLQLVWALLPQPGAELSFNIEDGKVTTELTLRHPVIDKEPI